MVDDLLPVWSLVVITGASAAFVGAAAIGGAILYSASHPAAAIAPLAAL